MRAAADRKSLFVPVVCLPALEGCWSINITDEGMGLVARPSDDGPFEGEMLDLDFRLPAGPRIRVRSVVRWRHESALGVRFETFEGTGLVELKRFLAEHRLRVVVFGAPRGLERA